MVIDTSEERSSRILANHLVQQVLATRVLIHERGNIVDEARDENQVAFLGKRLD